MISRLWLPAAAIALLASGSAQAHHVMDRRLPATFMEGLLSGLGHPIIGVDHLLFVIGVGAVAALYRRGYLLPIAFLLATVIGAGVHLRSIDLPAVELLVALSLIALGIWVALRTRLSAGIAAALLALAGLFHGYAYAESIIGAEPAPLAAYFIGFVIIQYVIALGASAVARRLTGSGKSSYAMVLRGAGGAIGAAGVLFLALNA